MDKSKECKNGKCDECSRWGCPCGCHRGGFPAEKVLPKIGKKIKKLW